ncbi:unnamed protein product [Durusdinium trenchii]|uniref:t-SNARE coiled-coil homology domain-containing protein n=1 Tax=Durusdinium trenchii TaxID=1381693 RepID=A0ABP0Q8G7_9DINO
MSYASTSRPSQSQARDGDSMYVQDSMAVSEAVKRIQQCTAEIRKETHLSPSTSSSSRKKVEGALHAGHQATQEATRRLEKLSHVGGSTFGEQRNRSLMQQKLSENLTKSIQDLQASFQAFELAEKKAESAPHGRSAAADDLEMGSMASGQRQQMTAEMVSEAELDIHNAIVDEYIEDISTLAQDVRGLQQAMADLSFHTKVQGDQLDSIEADLRNSTQATSDATEQLTQASSSQRRGSRFIYWLLLLAAVLAVILIFVVVSRSS